MDYTCNPIPSFPLNHFTQGNETLGASDNTSVRCFHHIFSLRDQTGLQLCTNEETGVTIPFDTESLIWSFVKDVRPCALLKRPSNPCTRWIGSSIKAGRQTHMAG